MKADASCSTTVCCICRYTNIQLINTIGVAKADKRECLECWCKVRCKHCLHSSPSSPSLSGYVQRPWLSGYACAGFPKTYFTAFLLEFVMRADSQRLTAEWGGSALLHRTIQTRAASCAARTALPRRAQPLTTTSSTQSPTGVVPVHCVKPAAGLAMLCTSSVQGHLSSVVSRWSAGEGLCTHII